MFLVIKQSWIYLFLIYKLVWEIIIPEILNYMFLNENFWSESLTKVVEKN